MDLATTVLEGHEQEVDNLKKLEALRHNLEDAENRTRRDNLHTCGVPKLITDKVQPLPFFRSWLQRFLWNVWNLTVFTGPWHPNQQKPPQGHFFKFHFYCTKERLLQAARNLSFRVIPSNYCGPVSCYHRKTAEPETLLTDTAVPRL